MPTPEMVFGSNSVRIESASGFRMDFRAEDALKLVDNRSDPVKVACAQKWGENRFVAFVRK